MSTPMRTSGWMIFLVLAALIASAAADAEREMRQAMGPYYAALVASVRGNTEATQRQLVLFAAKWTTASKAARTDAPEALRKDPRWVATLDKADQAIERAKSRVRERDAAGAHAALEALRHDLREVRAAHNLETFDDRFTDFHDQVERAASRVVGPDEIVLTPKDYEAIGEALDNARAAWKTLQLAAGREAGLSSAWEPEARRMVSAMDALQRAVSRREPEAVGTAARDVHERYYDLALALAR